MMHKVQITVLAMAAVMLVAALPACSARHLQQASSKDWYMLPRNAINGQDIDCAQQDYRGNALSYCKVCGGLSKVVDACKGSPNCNAIVMEVSGRCGYLKSSDEPQYYSEDFFMVLPGKAPTGSYQIIMRQSLPGQEIPCGQKDSNGNLSPRCRLCAPPIALMATCDTNPRCVGFDQPDDRSCGYLKRGTKGTYAEGTNSFIKAHA